MFNFNSELHEYSIGGKIIPSVTQLMSKYNIIDNTFYDLQGAVRGRHVHTATVYYDEGDLDVKRLDPILQPFVNAYIKFRKELPELKYTLSEKMMLAF